MHYVNGPHEVTILNAENFQAMFRTFLDALRIIENDPEFVSHCWMLYHVGKGGSVDQPIWASLFTHQLYSDTCNSRQIMYCPLPSKFSYHGAQGGHSAGPSGMKQYVTHYWVGDIFLILSSYTLCLKIYLCFPKESLSTKTGCPLDDIFICAKLFYFINILSVY